MNWKKFVLSIGQDVENKLDYFRMSLRDKLGLNRSVQICPYITYGSSETIFIKGRILQNRSIVTEANDNSLENMMNMYRRIASIEVPNASLKISFNGQENFISSDEDGFFEQQILMNISLPGEQLWHNPVVELLDSYVKFEKPLKVHARVMTPPITADFGILKKKERWK